MNCVCDQECRSNHNISHRRAVRFSGLGFVLFCAILGTASAQKPHTIVGDVRVHKLFHSRILNNDRDVLVYLPPGYAADKHKRYSVLYLHDGQNLFDGATSYIPGEEWRVDENAQSLISEHKVEPLIIVGINNMGSERLNEYTPVADDKYRGGKGDLYGRMLVEELKPFVDSTYRTRRDAKHTGLGGSSLGGLISLYLALKYPDVFGRVAVISPSVWFANHQIVHFVDGLNAKRRLRIWLDIGTREGRDSEEAVRSTTDARMLRDSLIKKGWRVGEDLKYFEAEGAEHNERAWAARLAPVLEYLFPAKRL